MFNIILYIGLEHLIFLMMDIFIAFKFNGSYIRHKGYKIFLVPF